MYSALFYSKVRKREENYTMEKIIEIESLTKHFSDKTALDDLSFYIKQKEIFGLLGPSGSGKTTIIKILTGQMKPSMGSTSLLRIPSEKLKQRNTFQKVGIMTDNSGLYDRLTVKDNLKLFCKIFSVSYSSCTGVSQFR